MYAIQASNVGGGCNDPSVSEEKNGSQFSGFVEELDRQNAFPANVCDTLDSKNWCGHSVEFRWGGSPYRINHFGIVTFQLFSFYVILSCDILLIKRHTLSVAANSTGT